MDVDLQALLLADNSELFHLNQAGTERPAPCYPSSASDREAEYETPFASKKAMVRVLTSSPCFLLLGIVQYAFSSSTVG